MRQGAAFFGFLNAESTAKLPYAEKSLKYDNLKDQSNMDIKTVVESGRFPKLELLFMYG